MQRVDLSLLYVGQPDTQRAKSFVIFLEARFASVRTASTADIGHLDFTGIDVALVDGKPMGPDAAKLPSPISLRDLPVPTVMIGGTGGRVMDQLGLKMGWSFGCLCLRHRAIAPTIDHAIFEGPFEVPVAEVKAIDPPDNFLVFAPVKVSPDPVEVIDIHAWEEPPADLQERLAAAQAAGDTKALTALRDESPTPGLVTTSAGFLDSPDTESILGGINAKAHDYVAVGRQARFVQWGFWGDPDAMTEYGQALFANTVAYAARFAGAEPVALRVTAPRDYAELAIRAAGRPVDGTIEGAGATDDPHAWWAVNRGYVRTVGSGRQSRTLFDEQCAALGIANDDLALLDEIAPDLAAAGEVGDRARLLWARYVQRDPADADRESAWLAEHRDSLFFSDWAGYRWISTKDPVELHPSRPLSVADGPVRALLAAHRGADGTVVSQLVLMLEEGWYVYAPGATDGIPVTVAPTAGSGARLAALPTFPETEDGHLDRYVTIEVPLVTESDEISLEVAVQACDSNACLPPATLTVTAHATRE